MGAEEELANERDQIPPQDLAVGHCYEVLPLSSYSPSDFTARRRDRQREYLSLMEELREIYAEKPGWLRLRGDDASRYIPVAYVSNDDWIGRGCVAKELANDCCILYDVDDGSFDSVPNDNLPWQAYKFCI